MEQPTQISVTTIAIFNARTDPLNCTRLVTAARLEVLNAEEHIEDGHWTLLSKAASEDSIGFVRLLVDRRVDVNFQDSERGLTALMFAARGGNILIVQILLDAEAHLDSRDNNGCTALMHAAQCNRGPVVKMLLKTARESSYYWKTQAGWIVRQYIEMVDYAGKSARDHVDMGASGSAEILELFDRYMEAPICITVDGEQNNARGPFNASTGPGSPLTTAASNGTSDSSNYLPTDATDGELSPTPDATVTLVPLGPPARQYHFNDDDTKLIEDVVELVRPCATREPRPMLRGRFATWDQIKSYEYQCVIKCAPVHDAGAFATECAQYEQLRELRRSEELRDRDNLGYLTYFYIHQCGEGVSYLVLEDHYRDLRALLYESPDDHRWRDYRIIGGLLKALKALHTSKIVHCHIKPENILYKVEGENKCVIKFCDLAHACCEKGHACGEEGLVLLPVPTDSSYLAPEVYRSTLAKERVSATFKLDVFAAALVVWQLVHCAPRSILHKTCSYYATASAEGLKSLIGHVRVGASCGELIAEMLDRAGHEGGTVELLALEQLHRSLKPEAPWDPLTIKIDALIGAVDNFDQTLQQSMSAIKIQLQDVHCNIGEVTRNVRAIAAKGTSVEELVQNLHAKTAALEYELGLKITAASSLACSDLRAVISKCTLDLSGVFTHQLMLSSEEHERTHQSLQQKLVSISDDVAATMVQHGDRQSEHIKASLVSVACDLRNMVLGIRDEMASLCEEISQEQERSRKMTFSMLDTVINKSREVPTLFVILPDFDGGTWKEYFDPTRLFQDKYRLFFVCEHTHQLVLCGPENTGYLIKNAKKWVLTAAPYIQTALVALSIALLATEIPLPVWKLCNFSSETKAQAKLLRAVFEKLDQPEGIATTAVLSEIDHTRYLDESDLKDFPSSAHASDLLHQLIECGDIENIASTSGLRPVSCEKLGHSAWVLNDDDTVQAWKDAWPQRIATKLQTLIQSLGRSVLAVAKAFEVELLTSPKRDAYAFYVKAMANGIQAGVDGIQLKQVQTRTKDRILQFLQSVDSVRLAAVSQTIPPPKQGASAFAKWELRAKELRSGLEALSEHDPVITDKIMTQAETGLCEEFAKLVPAVTSFVEEAARVQSVGDAAAGVLQGNLVLQASVMNVQATSSLCPQLAVLLPLVASGWKVLNEPLRLYFGRFRLVFLCSRTYVIMPGGARDAGFDVILDKEGLAQLIPVVQVGLTLLTSALRAATGPLPVRYFHPELRDKESQVQYLDTAMSLLKAPINMEVGKIYSTSTPLHSVVPVECPLADDLPPDGAYHALNTLYMRFKDAIQMREESGKWIADAHY